MPKIKLQERQLEVGYAIEGEGPPLFLLTGVMGSIDFYWKGLAPYLVNDFRLIMFDHRASGQTQDEGIPFTLEEMAQDTIALVRHFGYKKVHLLGHSMGAAIAQLLMHRYGAEFGKVILCNPFAKLPEIPQMVFHAAIDLLQEGVAFSKVLWTLLPWLYSESFIVKEIGKLRAFTEHFTFPLKDLQRQCAALSSFDATSLLAGIPNEVLAIGSREDILIPPSCAEEISDALSDSRLALIPGGHASTIEQPKQLAALIQDFLEES